MQYMESLEYKILAEYYNLIENESSRLEKTRLISELLTKVKNNTKNNEIYRIILLLQGKVFPEWSDNKTGISDKIVSKALSLATGKTTDEIVKHINISGDLGKTTEELISKKKQNTLFSSILTIEKVFKNIEKLSSLEGTGTISNKVQLVAELFTSASPIEAKYIARTAIGDLRVGASLSTIRDAVVKTFFEEIYENRDQSEENKKEFENIINGVQRAYDLINDLGEVAQIISEKGLKEIYKTRIRTLRPINPMLYFKAKNIEDGFDIVKKPALIEYKYDGFRVQVHKKNEIVKLFTRRLEDVSNQFPDIISTIKDNVNVNEVVLDCEVLGIDKKTGKLLPFQNISQRIRRKYDIQRMTKEIPVAIIVFDVLKHKDDDLLDTEFKKRRELLESIINVEKNKIEISEAVKTESIEEANSFYEKSLLLGNEGIMMKSLKKGYKPGSRVGYGVKIKPILESLDLFITKAEWGHGKRAGWFTSFTVSCMEKDRFFEIGKVGTGIKELEDDNEGLTFKKLTETIKPLIIKEQESFVEIKSSIIVEVDYEEIQKSTNYNSGYALRFPRIKRLRDDIKESSTIEDVKRIYEEQRGRNS